MLRSLGGREEHPPPNSAWGGRLALPHARTVRSRVSAAVIVRRVCEPLTDKPQAELETAAETPPFVFSATTTPPLRRQYSRRSRRRKVASLPAPLRSALRCAACACGGGGG